MNSPVNNEHETFPDLGAHGFKMILSLSYLLKLDHYLTTKTPFFINFFWLLGHVNSYYCFLIDAHLIILILGDYRPITLMKTQCPVNNEHGTFLTEDLMISQ